VSQPPRPFPTPLNAALITMMGIFFTTAIAVMVSDWATPTAAVGIATVLGLGGAGLLGATNIPPPHAERVGLRGLRRQQLLPLLLLLPIALLASEVDNSIGLLFPAPDAQQVVQETIEKLPTDTSLSVLETLIVAVGLVPVVEEWFFRGVLQQGLVASMGAVGGVLVTALFFALGHGAGMSPQAWGALVAQTLVLGVTFGYARHRTGSLLAPILLHIGVNGIGVAAMAAPLLIAIPGYNAPGEHTPLSVLLPAIVSVAVGAWLLSKEIVPAIPVVRVVDEGESYEDE
jgi:membrane protease YdiL (CAAX protease family)